MKLTVAAVAAVIALAAPAAANAGIATNPKMPKPESHRIAPPDSLGGISIGDDLDEANEAWGGQGYCGGKLIPESCFWGDFSDDRDGRAEIAAPEGTVTWVGISWNGCCGGKDKPDVRKGVANFGTKKGIHLGSKLPDVGKAYPNAGVIRHGGDGRIQAYTITDDDSGIVFGGGKFVNYINLYER